MPLLLPDCKMTFVTGPVASGKTHLIKRWVATDNRHVIFDSTGEYMDGETGVSHEQVWANPRGLYDRLKRNPYYYRLVYVPGRNRREDFTYVLDALWWIDQPKLLVCDEVADICPVDSMDDDIERVLRFARKDKMGFLASSQRIADVHKLFTGGCRMVVLFQTHEARDLDAIDERWGCAAEVQRLRPLLYDDITRTVQQVPQCLICEKGKEPYIFDFISDAPQSSPASDDGSRARHVLPHEPSAPASESELDNEMDEEASSSPGVRK